jgi:hypothetical protein
LRVRFNRGHQFQRLSNLRHFRRRRKAFERRCENGAGVGGAAAFAIELSQRQRRAQFKTARALPLRDCDGGQKGFFRRRRIGGVALQQNFASRPMQFCVERVMASAVT